MENIIKFKISDFDSSEKNLIQQSISFPIGFILDLGKAQNQQSLLDTISKWFYKVINAERASVALIDEDGIHFSVFALTGNDVISMGEKIPLEITSLGQAVAEEVIQIVNDNSFLDYADSKKLLAGGLKSHINVPIFVDDRIIGTLNAASGVEGKFKKDDAFIAWTFSIFLSTYFRNISQIEKIKTQAKNEKLLIEKNIESSRFVSLGQMAGGIAHEINNPLAVISSSIKVLTKAKESEKLSDEIFNKMIGTITDTTQRISKIVSGLRVVSRDSKNLNKELVSFQDLFDDVLSLCFEKFKNNNIEFIFDSENILLKEKFIGDRVQLSQVLINILTNAFDAVLDYDEKWVKVLLSDDNESFYIQIIDSGEGISKDIEDLIFNPFFTSKEVGKGTGLGLSLSKSMIENNEGKLSLDLDFKNTCFKIELPKTK